MPARTILRTATPSSTAARAADPSTPAPAPTGSADGGGADGAVDERRLRATALALGVYAAAFGLSFGAIATASGLTVAQATVLSLVLCSGASQFAFVGVLAGGGQAFAGALAAILLGLRNAAYGPAVRARVPVTGWRRLAVGMMTIDETAAVTVAEHDDQAARRAFRLSAVTLYATWSGGTLAGALLGDVLDPRALGLDAAVPVVFFALLWPALTTTRARVAALLAALLAVLLVPVVPAGAPVVVAAAVGVALGWPDPAPARSATPAPDEVAAASSSADGRSGSEPAVRP